MFKINFAASCKSSNIIYLITCRRCGQQYVGETGQLLHCRINGHRFNITHRNTEESPVVLHFNGEGHTLADMTIMAIDKIYSHDLCLRKIRESRWIRTLGTSYPLGMNLISRTFRRHVSWLWTIVVTLTFFHSDLLYSCCESCFPVSPLGSLCLWNLLDDRHRKKLRGSAVPLFEQDSERNTVPWEINKHMDRL